MSELTLGNQDLASIVVLALIALLVLFRAGRGSSSPHRWRRFRALDRQSAFDAKPEFDMGDIGDQLRAVMASSFQRRRVLSPSEYRVFRIIEDDVAAARRGYRVFAQTSLGEILRSPDASAFRSINSKRADILVIDHYGWPVLAVEYQGRGHYQGDAAGRDAVKKEALRKAGVGYVEILEADSDEQVRYRVREHLGWTTPPARSGASPSGAGPSGASPSRAEPRPVLRLNRSGGR